MPAPTSTLPSFTAGQTPDLVATAIEVTQGVQNLANDMPLVEGRLTVARVYVKTQDPDVPAANVKGVLAGFRDNQLLGIEYPENGPISAVPEGGLRTNLDDSLYFYLPGSWTSGSVLLRTFVYSTTPEAPYEEEPTEVNNFFDASVTFRSGDPLKVRLAPLHLHVGANAANPNITYYYEDHESDTLEIILHLLRFYPIATNGLSFDASSLLVIEDPEGPDIAVTSIKPLGHQDGTEWDLSQSADRGLANERIAFFESMAPEEYQDWEIYGMVDSTVSMGGYIGWANNGGTHGLMDNTTSAAIWNNTGGYALAHEIAHIFLSSPEHVDCAGGEAGPDPAYPYPQPNCQIAAIDPQGYYGFDTYWQLWGLPGPAVISNNPAAAANQFAFPMMGAKKPWWIDPFYYCRLLDAYGIACDPLALNVVGVPSDAAPPKNVVSAESAPSPANARRSQSASLVRATQESGSIYVSARVDTAADTAAFIDAMRMVDPAPGAIEASRAALQEGAPSRYVIAFDDAAGNMLASHVVPAPEPGAHGAPAGDPLFAAILPYPEGTAFLRLRRGDTVLAERAVSANAPVVRVVSPNGGERLVGAMDVRWEASDPDGDALRYTVMYSADAGGSWTPLAADLRDSSITLPSLDGIAGSGSALIRVLATDGVLTGFDDSGAPFSVPDSAPQAFIAGPAGGSTFPQGATVVMIGGAYDLEDGPLSGDSVRWTSSIDGDLGTGTQLMTDALSRGTHEVTLSARDSAGSARERSVTITIADPRPGQPDEGERRQAADVLLNGRDDDGGPPWLVIGIAAGAAAAVALAGGVFAAVRIRRRAT